MFFHWDYTTDYLEKKNQTCKCEPIREVSESILEGGENGRTSGLQSG